MFPYIYYDFIGQHTYFDSKIVEGILKCGQILLIHQRIITFSYP